MQCLVWCVIWSDMERDQRNSHQGFNAIMLCSVVSDSVLHCPAVAYYDTEWRGVIAMAWYAAWRWTNLLVHVDCIRVAMHQHSRQSHAVISKYNRMLSSPNCISISLSLYIYLYIYIYTYIHTHICIRMCIYIYIHICMCIYIYIYISLACMWGKALNLDHRLATEGARFGDKRVAPRYMYIYIYIYSIYMYIHIYTHNTYIICMCICMCVYIYIYICIYIYIYIYCFSRVVGYGQTDDWSVSDALSTRKFSLGATRLAVGSNSDKGAVAWFPSWFGMRPCLGRASCHIPSGLALVKALCIYIYICIYPTWRRATRLPSRVAWRDAPFLSSPQSTDSCPRHSELHK